MSLDPVSVARARANCLRLDQPLTLIPDGDYERSTVTINHVPVPRGHKFAAVWLTELLKSQAAILARCGEVRNER